MLREKQESGRVLECVRCQTIMTRVLEKLLFESRGISGLGYLDHFLSEVECSKVASAVSYRQLQKVSNKSLL